MEVAAWLASAANRVGLLDGYMFIRRSIRRSQIAIVTYHRVCPRQDTWCDALDPRAFRSQLEYFGSNYEMLALEDLVGLMKGGGSLPKKAIVITFDDGFKDNYVHAYPLLARNRVPATIFLATGHVGADRVMWQEVVGYAIVNTTLDGIEIGGLGSYRLDSGRHRSLARFRCVEKLRAMPAEKRSCWIDKLLSALRVGIPSGLGREVFLSWSDVREMGCHGIAFGAHTVNHTSLTSIALASARDEIVESKKAIEEALGQRVASFAYPWGRSVDFNNDVKDLVRRAGFDCAVTTIRDWVGPSSDPYAMGRIGALEDSNKFKVMLSGLWPDIQRQSNI